MIRPSSVLAPTHCEMSPPNNINGVITWRSCLALLTVLLFIHEAIFGAGAHGTNGTFITNTITTNTTSLAYSNKRLEFVHIPKTGGTIIETIAANHNVSWAACHFLGTALSLRNSNNFTKCPDAPETRFQKPILIHATPHWHLPPYYFLLRERYKYNPYAGFRHLVYSCTESLFTSH